MGSSDTVLAHKLTRAQYCNRCFLAMHRDHGNLDFALLDVEDTVRNIALGKNGRPLRTAFNRGSQPRFGEKIGGIEAAPIAIPRPRRLDDGCLDGACPLSPRSLHGSASWKASNDKATLSL